MVHEWRGDSWVKEQTGSLVGTANSIILTTRIPRKSSYQEVMCVGPLWHTLSWVVSTHSEGNLQNEGIFPLQNRKWVSKRGGCLLSGASVVSQEEKLYSQSIGAGAWLEKPVPESS